MLVERIEYWWHKPGLLGEKNLYHLRNIYLWEIYTLPSDIFHWVIVNRTTAKYQMDLKLLFSLGPKLNTKLTLHTTHPPTHHHHSQTFRPLPGILLVCWLNSQRWGHPRSKKNWSGKKCWSKKKFPKKNNIQIQRFAKLNTSDLSLV